MSAICRKFSSSIFRVSTQYPFRAQAFNHRFISLKTPRNTEIDLSFGLVSPLPPVKTTLVMKKFFSTIEQAIEGGITYVQLWGPNNDLQASLPIVIDLKNLTNRKNIPLIVNNCFHLALQTDLGVHLGQNDFCYHKARQLLPHKPIGLTVNSWSQVVDAQNTNITYLGVQIFHSQNTKPAKPMDPPPWGLEGAAKVISYTRHRVVLIGNITLATLPSIIPILRPGVGIAVAGEIMRAPDPYATTRAIHSLIKDKLQKAA